MPRSPGGHSMTVQHLSASFPILDPRHHTEHNSSIANKLKPSSAAGFQAINKNKLNSPPNTHNMRNIHIQSTPNLPSPTSTDTPKRGTIPNQLTQLPILSPKQCLKPEKLGLPARVNVPIKALVYYSNMTKKPSASITPLGVDVNIPTSDPTTYTHTTPSSSAPPSHPITPLLSQPTFVRMTGTNSALSPRRSRSRSQSVRVISSSTLASGQSQSQARRLSVGSSQSRRRSLGSSSQGHAYDDDEGMTDDFTSDVGIKFTVTDSPTEAQINSDT